MEKAIPTDLSGARLIYYYGKVGTEISICSKVSFDFLLNGALPTLLLALFFYYFLLQWIIRKFNLEHLRYIRLRYDYYRGIRSKGITREFRLSTSLPSRKREKRKTN